jgi:hypothetical protein
VERRRERCRAAGGGRSQGAAGRRDMRPGPCAGARQSPAAPCSGFAAMSSGCVHTAIDTLHGCSCLADGSALHATTHECLVKCIGQPDAHVGHATTELTVYLQAQVVVSTCASAGAAPLQGRFFRMLVVDEATQATEPMTLIPLVRHTRLECANVFDFNKLSAFTSEAHT